MFFNCLLFSELDLILLNRGEVLLWVFEFWWVYFKVVVLIIGFIIIDEIEDEEKIIWNVLDGFSELV